MHADSNPDDFDDVDEWTLVAVDPQNRTEGKLAITRDIRISGLVGQGTSSEVFQGENRLAQKACAVKLFRRELNVGPVARGRYTHDARGVSQLEHPHIASVYRIGTTPDNRVFSTQELVAGHDLKSLIRRHNAVQPHPALTIAQQVSSALAAAHEQGWAHLRLHPGNLMLLSRDNVPFVKLLDFGSCHLYPDYGEISPELPQPEDAFAYLAPEVLTNSIGDPRSDIFSLGVILYQMLTGKLPFVAANREALLEAYGHVPKAPSDVAAVTSQISDAILRALAKDPNHRFKSMESFTGAINPRFSGQHRALKRRSTGMQRVLTASHSSEINTRALDAESTGSIRVPAESSKKGLLIVALLVTALLCAAAVFLLT